VSIWIFLWLFLSAALLYFMGWTVYIVFRQKQVWGAYARKHKLRYKDKGFWESPEIGGSIHGYTVGVFVGEHLAEDARKTRKLTAVEVQLSSTMPIEGGVASGGLVSVLQGMTFKEEMRPEHKNWDKSYIASASDKAVLEAYLTPKRLDALTELMAIKNVWIILVFRGDIMLLRMDTPDPMDKAKNLDLALNKMIAAARVLELESGEVGFLKSEQAKKRSQHVALSVDGEDLIVTGLQLEDDDEGGSVDVDADSNPVEGLADNQEREVSGELSGEQPNATEPEERG
jgi:hypothetical protein